MQTDTARPETEAGAQPERADLRRVARTVRNTLGLAWQASRSGVLVMTGITVGAAVLPPIVVALSRRAVNLVATAALDHTVRAAQIIPWVVAMGALGALQRVLSGIQSDRQEVFSFLVNRHAERLFLEKASNSDLARFDDPNWHDRVQRVSRDINFRPYQLSYQSIGIIGSLVTLLGMLGILLSLHPILLVLAVVSVVIPIPFQRRINRQIYEFWFSLTAKEREQWYYRWLLSDTRPAKDLRAFGLESPLLDRHQSLAMERFAHMRRLYRKSDRVAVFSGVLGGAALVVAYVFVAYRGASGSLSPGAVTALIGAIASVTAQVGGLSGSLIAIDQHAPFLEDFFDFLSIQPTVDVVEHPVSVPARITGGIEFDNVTFAYPGLDRPALDHLTFRIDDGEMVALVGDNGAGKTTMVKLLLRFYDAQEGSVRIGGVDLRETRPADLRKRVGVLFQDYTSFTMRARDAVHFGRIDDEPDEERIWRALESARADDIVRKLPSQLDSFVGRMFEGGKDLSGGEWQRLALARLIFRDAGVWILDEPTSSLDPEAEAAIFSELRAHLAGRIGIVISHRFSTVRIADRIAVVQDGRVSEMGTHEELLARGGRYAHLFELQAAGYR